MDIPDLSNLGEPIKPVEQPAQPTMDEILARTKELTEANNKVLQSLAQAGGQLNPLDFVFLRLEALANVLGPEVAALVEHNVQARLAEILKDVETQIRQHQLLAGVPGVGANLMQQAMNGHKN